LRHTLLPAAALLALASLLPLDPVSTPRAQAYAGSDAVQRELEQMRDAGQLRALAPAQARYREALAALHAGNSAEGERLLGAAAEFDPAYPDPHFTLARTLAFRNPERAVGELGEAFRIVGRSYSWQRHLLANVVTAFLVVWILGLLFAVVGITLRHLPHLIHIITELTGRSKGALAQGGATLIALCPLLWGLGPIPTATVYAGLISFRIGRREAVLVGLFIVSSIAFASFATLVAPWAAPPSLEEPSLLVDHALRCGADASMSRSLQAWALRTERALFPSPARSPGGSFDTSSACLPWPRVPRRLTLSIWERLLRARGFRPARYEAARRGPCGAATSDLRRPTRSSLCLPSRSRASDRVRPRPRLQDLTPQLNRTAMEAICPRFWDSACGRLSAALPYQATPSPVPSWAARALRDLPRRLLSRGSGMVGPLSTLPCSNCQKVVCRRCVFRMQQRAFCEGCYGAVKDLKSMEFTRLLLTGRGSRAARRRTFWETATAFLLPGAGQMLRGASLSGFVAILILVGAAVLVIANGALIPSPDILPLDSGGWSKRIPLTLLFVLTYVITVARYYAKTTDKAPGITQSMGRPSARPAAGARAEGGRR
jgi:hypothetical protein